MTKVDVVNNIVNVIKLLLVGIIVNLQTQAVSPGQDELTDPEPWTTWPENLNQRHSDS